MKTFLKSATAATLAAIMALTSLSANATEESPITVTIDGIAVEFVDQQPVVVDESTLVPVRAVFETLGFTVLWLPEHQRVTMFRGNKFLDLTLNESRFTLSVVGTDGNTTQVRYMDVPAQMINDRIMVPIRALVEGVGYTVEWCGDDRVVGITTSLYVPTIESKDKGLEDPPAFLAAPESSFLGVDAISHLDLRDMVSDAPAAFDTRSRTPITTTPDDAFMESWMAEYERLGGVNRTELEIVIEVNRVREAHGLRPLNFSVALGMAARLHAQDLSDNLFIPIYARAPRDLPPGGAWVMTDELREISARMEEQRGRWTPNIGSTITQLQLLGFTYFWIPIGNSIHGNVATNRVPASEVAVSQVAAWMNSEYHRNILLDPHSTYIGVGSNQNYNVLKFDRFASFTHN